MTNNRVLTITAAAATAGGIAWLSKLAVIAVTDGQVTSTGAAAMFFILGVVLMASGAGVVSLRLFRPQSTRAVIGAALSGPFVFVASFVVLESIAKSVVGDAGPVWLADELGILAMGIAWLVIGLSLLRGALADRVVVPIQG